MSEVKYRIWYIPQIPMDAFTKEVEDLDTAKLLLNTIIDFSIFEYNHRVKPDYADASGIDRWDGEEWESLDEEERDSE